MPPEPPDGPGGHRDPGRRPSPLFILLAAIVAVGVIAAVVLMLSGGDDTPDKTPPGSSQSPSRTPEPSFSIPTELPSRLPSRLPTKLPTLPSRLPTELPTAFPRPRQFPVLESLVPLAGDEVPYYMLRTGDCFNADSAHPGQAAKRACDDPHDAEVVKVTELEGRFSTDGALKRRRRRAVSAGPGTRGGRTARG